MGRRVRNVLEDAGQPVDVTFAVPVSANDITRLVQELLPCIQTWQEDRHLDKLIVFYNQRTSAATSRPHSLQFLPISEERFSAWRATPWHSRSTPTFTMSWEDLLSKSVRQYLFVALFRACAESLASENASRIASMQLAEKNIEERLAELTTQFYQLRQTAITEELLDVVTGFEALRGRSKRYTE
jgi:F-type H+-transporting ATPase subunit gamma